MEPKGRFIRAVRVVRTFFLVCIGDLFFRASSVGDAFAMLKGAVSVFNPSVLWNGAVLGLGLDWIEMGIVFVSLAVLCAVSVMQQKGPVRDKIAGMALPLRWAIWYMLLFSVILLGCYGPGYSAGEFIYQGF